jgi:hypothetical protein
MYNKLFTRILDSSIWCEDYPTRLVWIMFLAAMDEDGVVHMATVRNVATRANVTLEEAEAAIAKLQAPDPSSSNLARDGRRIERFPGGWLVVNAGIYRDIATRLQARAKTAERVRKYRAKEGNSEPDVTLGNASVTLGNAAVTVRNDSVTTSEAYTEAEADTDTTIAREKTARSARDGFDEFWQRYPRKVARQAALKAWSRISASVPTADIMAGLDRATRSEQWTKDGGQFVPHAATWLNGGRWTDDLPAAAGRGPVPAAPAAQRVDPCFGMPVPFTKGGAVWWRWYDWIVHQYSGGQIGDAEFDAVQAKWDAYMQGQKQ